MTSYPRRLIPGAATLAGIALTAVLLLLFGCATVGPDYVRPDLKAPQAWSTSAAATAPAPEKAPGEAPEKWWTLFQDPVLTGLVQRIVAGNLSLKQALARIVQARAQRRAARADLLPGASWSTSASVSGYYDNADGWSRSESYSTALDVSWEVDLFGRIARGVEAARADYLAAQEDRRDVLVSLAAEAVTAYINLRTYQKRLESARENLELKSETLDLTKIKYQTGMAGALNVEQAAYSLESTRAQIPALEASIGELMNRLAVLLGGWPGDLEGELKAPRPIPTGDLKTALGAPIDLIRRRPDLRALEQRLAAQTARLGEAQGGLYPRLTLNGSLGLSSPELGDLVSKEAMEAGVGVGFSWSVFNRESIKGGIEKQNALLEEARLEYETTLRTAVEEVENALLNMIKEEEKAGFLSKAVASAQEAAQLALQEYESGITDFQTVLETQQSLSSLKDDLSQSLGQGALNMVTLHKALGGGWPLEEGAQTSPAAGSPGQGAKQGTKN